MTAAKHGVSSPHATYGGTHTLNEKRRAGRDRAKGRKETRTEVGVPLISVETYEVNVVRISPLTGERLLDEDEVVVVKLEPELESEDEEEEADVMVEVMLADVPVEDVFDCVVEVGVIEVVMGEVVVVEGGWEVVVVEGGGVEVAVVEVGGSDVVVVVSGGSDVVVELSGG